MAEERDWWDIFSLISGIIAAALFTAVIAVQSYNFTQDIRMSDEERMDRTRRRDAESMSQNVKSICIDGKKFVMTRERYFLAPDSWNAVQVFETDENGKLRDVQCGG